jgi:Transposase IS116/IS110/IS902 family
MKTKNVLKSETRKEIKNALTKGVMKTDLSPEEFGMYVTQLFYIDDVQTKFRNQRRSKIVNEYIKDDTLFPEIQRLRRIENGDDKAKKKVAELIKQALINQINLRNEKFGIDIRVDMKTVEPYVNDMCEREYDKDTSSQVFEIFEMDRIKDVEKYLNKIPVYINFCKKVKGLGVKLSAKLIAGIKDIERFPNPSSLWSYCGVGDPLKSKLVAKQTAHFSPKMRATLYNVAESFIKAGSQYRSVYDKRKAETLIKHPEWHNLKPCPIKNIGDKAPKADKNGIITWSNQHPKHADKDAKRVMIKRFLAELFVAWYRSKGMNPPSEPYGVEIQGHHKEAQIVEYDNVLQNQLVEIEEEVLI